MLSSDVDHLCQALQQQDHPHQAHHWLVCQVLYHTQLPDEISLPPKWPLIGHHTLALESKASPVHTPHELQEERNAQWCYLQNKSKC